MNEFLIFLKDYGSLINLAVVLTILGLLWNAYKEKKDSTIEQLNSRINLMEEQLKIQSGFTIENVNERFKSLKEYYEMHVKDWYEKSLEMLNSEKEKAIQQKQSEYEARLVEEIKKREEVKANYDLFLNQLEYSNTPGSAISARDFVGKFSVSGQNPGITPGTYIGSYSGVVEINLLGQIYGVRWTLESAKPEPQIMHGRGLLARNMLSVTFEGKELPSNRPMYGLICYELIGNEIIRGMWIGLDSKTVGFEELRRISSESSSQES